MMNVIFVVSVLLHFLLAPVWLAALRWRPRPNRVALAAHLGFVVSWVVLMHLGGAAWHLASVPGRWAVLAVSCLLTIVVVRRHTDAPRLPARWTGWIAPALLVVVTLPNVAGIVDIVGAQTPEGDGIELQWPLPEGTSYVVHGGDSEVTNHHNSVPAQRHALDVVQLYTMGYRAKGTFPTTLERYAIFGAPLVAPCDGTVAHAVDGLPDLSPPNADPKNLAGNHLILHCDGNTVLLAHLRLGSVRPKSGEVVHAGQPVAEVGNSGNTTEPHLHIHALGGETTDLDTIVGSGEGLPMYFDGRYLTRTMVVRP